MSSTMPWHSQHALQHKVDDTLLANVRPIPYTPFGATRSSFPTHAHRRSVLGRFITDINGPICTQVAEEHAEIYPRIDKLATQYERNANMYTEGVDNKFLTADEQDQVTRWIDQEITRAKHPDQNEQLGLSPRLKARAVKYMAALDSYREGLVEKKDVATSA